MMKLVFGILAFVMVLPASVMASPAVGDSATYVGTTVQNGESVAFESTAKITAHDAAADKYTITETTTVNGDTTSAEHLVDANQLPSDSMINDLLTNCAAQGGTLETIEVEAGSFDTCLLTDPNTPGDFYNIGKVPFAVVKLSQGDTKVELKAFELGSRK